MSVRSNEPDIFFRTHLVTRCQPGHKDHSPAPRVYFGFEKAGDVPTEGKITWFRWLLIVSIFPCIGIQEALGYAHTHTHSASLGNNVSVNFKWIPRWNSLSQVKKQKKKETISIIERGCLLRRDVFQVIWNRFKSFLNLVDTMPIAFRVVILAFSCYIMNILFVTHFFVDWSAGGWLPGVYFKNWDNSARLI